VSVAGDVSRRAGAELAGLSEMLTALDDVPEIFRPSLV
jgi:hypothetical protein